MNLVIPGVKNKVYIAVCGIPDCGKSTFIKTLVEYMTKRKVDIDSFCNEQILDRTIRSSQLFFRDESMVVDYVFLDCPGHIDEYPQEVESCISKANIVIHIVDCEREQKSNNYASRILSLCRKYNIDSIHELYSHSDSQKPYHYDAKNSKIDRFEKILDNIHEWIGLWAKGKLIEKSINPVDTACRIINQTISKNQKCGAMCSFGKDSLVMLQLFKLCGVIDKINIDYPNSGYDLPGISEDFRKEVEEFFGIDKIEPYANIRNGWTFDNHSVQGMMLCKAEMLNERILDQHYKFVFTGIRRDEEGTRAKEKFFSPRKIDGSFDCYASQTEIFNHESDIVDILKENNQINHFRVNPLLDLTESDIWYITKYFNLPVCSEYFSKDGYRYRSLGDWPTTTPIESDAKTLDEICSEVSATLIPERACRQKQDNSVKYGMEKLRTKGFF